MRRERDSQPLLDDSNDANTSSIHDAQFESSSALQNTVQPNYHIQQSQTDQEAEPQPLRVPTDDEFVNPIRHNSPFVSNFPRTDLGPHWTLLTCESENERRDVHHSDPSPAAQKETSPGRETGAIPKPSQSRRSYMGEPVAGAGTTSHGPTATDLPGLNPNPDFSSYFNMNEDGMENPTFRDMQSFQAITQSPRFIQKLKQLVEDKITRKK